MWSLVMHTASLHQAMMSTDVDWLCSAVIGWFSGAVIRIWEPRIWKRYVDDTFTKLDRGNVDSFLQHLNNQQSSIRFAMETSTLRSHLVRPKDAVEPTKQDGVVYRIPCECGKVYIGETGRPMQDTMKEHERDIRLALTQTSAVSEHANNTGHNPLWNEVKFIDRDPHWYTRRVKKAIHIRLYPNNINRDSGIEIPES